MIDFISKKVLVFSSDEEPRDRNVTHYTKVL